MKKIIPAISMTLLSAAMLGTSTYAWFSQNANVSASGMKLVAEAKSSLLISIESDKNFTNSVTTSADNGMNPTIDPTKATFDSSAGTYSFKKLNDDGKAIVGADGQLVIPSGKTEEDYVTVDTTTDYFHDVVYLQYMGDSSVKIETSFTLTGPAANIDTIYKAIHIAIVVDKVNYEIEDFAALGEIKTVSGVFTVEASNPGSPSTTAVDIYAWVDGDEEECYNNAALHGEEFKLEATFTTHKSHVDSNTDNECDVCGETISE